MPIRVCYAGGAKGWPIYGPALHRAFDAAGLQVDLSPEPGDPAGVDYLIYDPQGPVSDFRPFTRARAVLSLWAGVERIVGNPTLTQPLCRMVDPGMTQGMVEWVTGHVLRHHLGMDRHILRQDGAWAPAYPPLAGQRPVTVLGMGALGRACGRMLAALGFPVTGWSRGPRVVEGLTTLHGPETLEPALREAQIVVLLLPLTAETENLLDAERLSWLPEGAVILNPGRGPLIDDAALLAGLDTGRIGHATLDVFRTEPLPPDHPFWAHPRITVTPHVAAGTRPETAAGMIAENIRRGEAGEPLLNLVDRVRGY